MTANWHIIIIYKQLIGTYSQIYPLLVTQQFVHISH